MKAANKNNNKRSFTKRAALFLFVKVPLFLAALSVFSVLVYKWCPVLATPLMIERSIEYRNDPSFKTRKTWVPYDKISPEMARAVIASEDNLFDSHNGFDMKAIRQAAEENKRGRRLRGGSTISQQTAKNVFCLPHRTWVRKGVETWFTILIETFWSKRRIMEVYLNVVEMGKGIYGTEAAARELFGTHALALTRHQCCLLASTLPRPLVRNAKSPSSYMQKRAYDIESLEGKIAYPAWVYHRKDTGKRKRGK